MTTLDGAMTRAIATTMFATAIVTGTGMMSGTSLDQDGIWVTATTIDQTTTASISEIAMAVIETMTRADWGVVGARTTVTEILTATRATAMTSGGQSAIATHGIVTSIPATCSCGTSIYPADATEQLSTTPAAVNIRCGGPRPGLCRRSGRFGSCRHATSATTTIDPQIRDQATCDISAKKDSSELSGWTVIESTTSS